MTFRISAAVAGQVPRFQSNITTFTKLIPDNLILFSSLPSPITLGCATTEPGRIGIAQYAAAHPAVLTVFLISWYTLWHTVYISISGKRIKPNGM